MKTQFISSASRGSADYGWLNTKHSFSFANYHDPNRVHFGALRVLNDDIVAPGEGFSEHPHRDMEIISIPLSGALAHRDSMGHEQIITTGEVQVMSAGSGLTHAEYNASKTDVVNFLQIWIIPNVKSATPRYEQKHFDFEKRNSLIELVNGTGEKDALKINQDATIYFLHADQDYTQTIKLSSDKHGVFVFQLEGTLEIGQELLNEKDALQISATENFELKSKTASKTLIIEVPL